MEALIALTLGTSIYVAARAIRRGALERRRIRRVLHEHPPLGLETPEGTIARIRGVVRLGDRPTIAPLTGRTCASARVRIFARGSSSMPYDLLETAAFFVETTEHGLVHVTAKYTQLDVARQLVPATPANWPQRKQLLREHLLRDNFWGAYEEAVVEVGATISVSGLVMTDLPDTPSNAERGFRDDERPTFRIAGDLHHPVLISDADA